MSPDPEHVVREIALLYELSLSVGTSLDLRTCCLDFLRVLVARKSLTKASVWLRDEETGTQRLVCALPAAHAGPDTVPATHPMATLDAPTSFLAGDPRLDPASFEEAGAVAVLPLAGAGVLRFHDAARTEPFAPRELRQLREVVGKFGVAVQACLVHDRLERETEERRRAEEATRLAFTRLDALVRWSPSGVLVYDEHRCVSFVNETFCTLFGLDAPPESLIGAHGRALSARLRGFFRDPEGFEAGIEQVLRARVTRTDEEVVLADDRVLTRDFVPIYVDGAYRGHLWQYRDVTERHAAQLEVDRLRRFYQQVLEAMPSHLTVFDAEGRYRFVSANTVPDATLREALIGRTDVEFDRLRGRDRDTSRRRMEAIARTVQSGQAERFEEAVPNGNGGVRWFERFMSPVVGERGEVSHVVVYGIDITERKLAEDALAASEARYKQLVEHGEDLIYTADLTGRLTFVNAVAARVTGYSEAALLRMRYLDLVAPAHRDTVRRFYRRQLARREPTTYLEFPLVTATGETLWMGQNLQLVEKDRGAGPRPVAIQALARDVTARRRAVEELVAAREVAERAVRAREVFLANMSHEMRTPLNAVIGTGELLRQTRLDDDQRSLLDALQYAAETLLMLINDALDLAKLESGRMAFEAAPFRVRDVAEGVGGMLRLKAMEKGVGLDVTVAPDVPPVLVGDAVRVNQVLLNLVSNAVKFTEAGGVRVSVRVAAREGARVSVAFEVADTGIGIPEAKQAAIFERFVQASSDTTRKYGGTGLGLAIAREIIERQGGTLTLRSVEGEGSTFTATLPFEEGVEGPAAAVEAEADLTGLRVLVVDDNPMNRYVARRMLEQWGAQVVLAEDGRQAVDAVMDTSPPRFDLVLMDVQMPVMDGLEATRRIRALHPPDALPILALTASVLPSHRPTMTEAGMNDVLFKPFRPDVLRRTVATFARRAANEPAREAPSAAPPEPALDFAWLEAEAEGDRAFVAQILGMFVRDVPELIARLEAAAEADDAAELAAVAHRLKGSAGIVGASHLAAVLRRIAEGAPEGAAAVQALVGDARAEATRVIDAVRAWPGMAAPP